MHCVRSRERREEKRERKGREEKGKKYSVVLMMSERLHDFHEA